MDMARAVADALMYDSHLAYPYGAVAAEDRLRWGLGVLLPPSCAGAGDRRAILTECLLETRDESTLHVKVRCLQVQAKTVQERRYGAWRDVPSLTVGGVAHASGDETVEREINAVVPVDAVVARPRAEDLLLPGGADVASLPGDPEQRVGRLVRRCWPIAGRLRIAATPLPGPYGVVRLRLELSNVDDWAGRRVAAAGCDEALRHSLVAAHLLVAASDGTFLSLLDPPAWARPAAAECDNDGVFPVLAGSPGRNDVVFASPLILYDHPTIAADRASELPGGTAVLSDVDGDYLAVPLDGGLSADVAVAPGRYRYRVPDLVEPLREANGRS